MCFYVKKIFVFFIKHMYLRRKIRILIFLVKLFYFGTICINTINAIIANYRFLVFKLYRIHFCVYESANIFLLFRGSVLSTTDVIVQNYE